MKFTTIGLARNTKTKSGIDAISITIDPDIIGKIAPHDLKSVWLFPTKSGKGYTVNTSMPDDYELDMSKIISETK